MSQSNIKNMFKYLLVIIATLSTTLAIMIVEEMEIDFTQKMLMTLIFIASFACYFKLFINKKQYGIKGAILLAVIFALFKYCQLTKDSNTEFIYFFKYLKTSPIKSITAILGYTFLYYAIINGLYYLFNKLKNIKVYVPEKVEKILDFIFEKHPLVLTGVIIFVLWLPHIIIQYPGVVSWDSDAEIAKYLWDGEVFSSHYPVFHIWLLGSVITTCQNVLNNTNIGFFFLTMLNVVLGVLVFANTFRIMKELKTSVLFRIICLGVYGVLPTFIGYIIINVKDTIYALAIVLLISVLIKMILGEEKFWNNTKEWLLHIVATILIILTRNNGIHLMIVVSLAILGKIIISKKQILKKIAIVVVPIIISEIIIQTITVYYGVLPGEKGEMYSFPMQQTARYIYFYKDEVTEEEEKILRKTLAFDEVEERYNPIISDRIKDTFTNISVDYIKVYIAQFMKRPNIYIDATLNMIYRLFVPDIIIPEYQTTFASNYHGVQFEEPQIKSLAKPRELLYYYYRTYNVLPITNILSGYGTYNCLALVIMIFLIKDKRGKELFVYIPIIVTIGILILSPVACFRYCLPIVFSIPVLLAHYLRNNLREEQKDEK